MTRFNSRIGAALLVGLAALYAAGAAATGHSAHSEIPPDLAAVGADSGVDVWQTVALLADARGALLVDTRSEAEQSRYAIPGAFALPEAAAKEIEEKASYGTLVLVANSDEIAQKLVGEVRTIDAKADVRYLRGGARSWYLAFDLPVAMFSTAPEPHGYRDAHMTARHFVYGSAELRSDAREAALTLAKLNYTPDLLAQGTKPKAAAGARKKISGGCGG